MTPDERPGHLPPGLTATVRVVEDILGRVVADAEGDALYDVVERVRRDMVAFREAEDGTVREEALDRATDRLGGLSIPQKTALARAFTLYLQLVNVCENAYRTHRLRERLAPEVDASPRASVTFVLTAHPTESRSPENIRLLRRVQDLVLESLARSRPIDRREVGNLIRLAWRAGTYPPKKPSVEDEANHLFSLLTDPILAETIALGQAGHRVLFRTWVGGDKDGHPGVGPAQTQASLGRGRSRLLAFVDGTLLPPVREDAAVSGGEAVTSALSGLEAAVAALGTVGDGDGARVEDLRRALDAFQRAYRGSVGVDHPAIVRLRALLEVFPALVIPLELREERGRFGAGEPIAGMMRRIGSIAGGTPIDAYARAVVVSMTLDAPDLLEAQRLADDVLGPGTLPVIPLFELPDVLERAPDILAATWKDEAFRAAIRTRGYLEVMLGYSDTAKRMGMLASRVALHDAMRRIGEWAESAGPSLLFFHGHGGSVGRGGGRIEDLAATWPPHARTPYKYTVQGEMVERTFATPEILRSLVEKVAAVQADPPAYRPVGPLLRRLAHDSGAAFATRVESASFRRLLELATPYGRLRALTIGSRPTARPDDERPDHSGPDAPRDDPAAGGDWTAPTADALEGLRAIPWVLCWTQTRLLLHAWLGAGHAWRERRDDSDIEEALARAREEDPLFRSWSRLLSFTMAKTELAVWRRYRRRLAAGVAEREATDIEEDFDAAMDLACRAVGGDSLLPDRPWLEESIRYRAPMIHPLNLLQIELLARADWSEEEARLFRETVTGIASGMLTTG